MPGVHDAYVLLLQFTNHPTGTKPVVPAAASNGAHKDDDDDDLDIDDI